jgi:putative methionine-R-sulfoxide reductase with GAF domain
MNSSTPEASARPADRENLLARMLGLSHIMVVQTDLGQLLSSIMREAARLVRAERATLYLLNQAAGELISYIAQEAEVHEIRLPVGRGVAGHVAATGRAVNLPNAYASEHFDPSWDRRTGFRTRSMLCVPMRDHAGRITGVLQALNCRAGSFSEADQSLLTLFASHAAIAIENARLHDDLKLAFRSTIRALSQAVDRRDPRTYGHSQRVTYYAVSMGQAVGLTAAEVEALECAATLHDVGKIAVSDLVLLKEGALNDEEYALMKEHARFTRDILAKCYFTGTLADVPLIAGAHHERLDGSGYPDGLRGDEIPLAARILAVADVFDALTSSDRLYRPAMNTRKALAILKTEAGTKLDREVVQTFIAKRLYEIDRRAQVRIAAGLEIEYRIMASGRSVRQPATPAGGTLDVSGGGLLFRTHDFIPVGTHLETAVHAGDQDIELVAEVVRCERSVGSTSFDVGISFYNLPEPVREKLQAHFVEMSRA